MADCSVLISNFFRIFGTVKLWTLKLCGNVLGIPQDKGFSYQEAAMFSLLNSFSYNILVSYLC